MTKREGMICDVSCELRCPPHYFLLTPQGMGPVALGVCKRCGECRSFSNVWPDEYPDFTRHTPLPGEVRRLPALPEGFHLTDKEDRS